VKRKMRPEYKNILIICLRKIGDAVIATSVAYMLKQAYPDAKITMLVKPLTREIVTGNPVIDDVMLYNYSHEAKFREIRQVAADIRQRNFDLCIVADNKPRSAMLAWLAGIPNRVGFENITLRNVYLKLFYTRIIKTDYDASQTLQAKNHEIFVNRFTKAQHTAKMIMPEGSAANVAKVEALLSQVLTDQAKERQACLKIALCIRSGVVTKDWPVERFAAVIDKLAERYNAVFYVIGSVDDAEVAASLTKMVHVPVSILCGKTSLVELACLLRKSDFFLTVDTGSAHIAATTGIPMVAVYGSTSPRKWGPYSGNAVTLSPDYHCHPCDGTKIKCSKPLCLLTISVDDVVAACEKKLKGLS
jgi:heptosyltransferase-2